ncbi:MAG: hypothetical protein HC888_02060 [Candidatus Competibacteraceae bacterium]|nr:hypothetical protein [Candidatus Competibacteraceae bacterium]
MPSKEEVVDNFGQGREGTGMAHEIDSPVSEETMKRLFGELEESELSELTSERRKVIEALGRLLVRKEPVTKGRLAREAVLKQSEVVRHIDLWKQVAEKTTEEVIVEAVRELQESGELVTRKKLAEKTGFLPNRLSRRRGLWVHAVAVPVRKSRGVIEEVCEKLQEQNLRITIEEVARESGLSKGSVASHKQILSKFATFEDDPKIGKYAQGRPNASASEVFRESVERLTIPEERMFAKKDSQLNTVYSSLKWYLDLSPTQEDRDWIGVRISKLKAELSRRNLTPEAQ